MADSNNTFLQWLMSLPDKMWGFVDKLRDWTKEQKIFFYSLLFTLLVLSYITVLPRYDCSYMKNEKACSFIEKQYEKKIQELN